MMTRYEGMLDVTLKCYAHPVGQKPNQPFQFLFNATLKVDFQGSRVTSNVA